MMTEDLYRKAVEESASTVQDTVSISSSDSSIDLGVLDDDVADNQQQPNTQTPNLQALAPSPPSSPTSTLRTPRTATSRFRHIAPPTQPSTVSSAQQSQPRPSFMARLRQPPADRGPHPGLAFTLPEAFSPSRRRGKGGAEYLHGGSAELVRYWVLEAAGRAGDGEGDVILRVGGAVSDEGGRFVFVRPSERSGLEGAGEGEEEGLMWLLVDSDSHLRRDGGRKVDSVRSGMEIVVKGGRSMRWRLPLGEDGQSCMFAALWDVK